MPIESPKDHDHRRTTVSSSPISTDRSGSSGDGVIGWLVMAALVIGIVVLVSKLL